jgi:hypothetical protein
MFARLIKIDGFSVWVNCTPETPFSELLRSAAEQVERMERMRLIEQCAVMGRLWSAISYDDKK